MLTSLAGVLLPNHQGKCLFTFSTMSRHSLPSPFSWVFETVWRPWSPRQEMGHGEFKLNLGPKNALVFSMIFPWCSFWFLEIDRPGQSHPTCRLHQFCSLNLGARMGDAPMMQRVDCFQGGDASFFLSRPGSDSNSWATLGKDSKSHHIPSGKLT